MEARRKLVNTCVIIGWLMAGAKAGENEQFCGSSAGLGVLAGEMGSGMEKRGLCGHIKAILARSLIPQSFCLCCAFIRGVPSWSKVALEETFAPRAGPPRGTKGPQLLLSPCTAALVPVLCAGRRSSRLGSPGYPTGVSALVGGGLPSCSTWALIVLPPQLGPRTDPM